MPSANDYLNLSELRELAEIESDLAGYRPARKDLNTRKATIKAQAVKRRDDAERRLRREMEATDCRRVIV